LNPRTQEPKASIVTSRPPKPLPGGLVSHVVTGSGADLPAICSVLI
jgi:hypothetical protein